MLTVVKGKLAHNLMISYMCVSCYMTMIRTFIIEQMQTNLQVVSIEERKLYLKGILIQSFPNIPCVTSVQGEFLPKGNVNPVRMNRSLSD